MQALRTVVVLIIATAVSVAVLPPVNVPVQIGLAILWLCTGAALYHLQTE